MSMATSLSDRDFHDLAKSLKPDQVIKPTRYWVGILYHDKKTSEVSQEADFLWIKAHGKITVQTIQEQYFTKSPTDIALKLNDSVPPKEARLAELNIYNDNIVIFRALELNAPELQQRREPLSPVTRQISVKSAPVETYDVKPLQPNKWGLDKSTTKIQPWDGLLAQTENMPIREETTGINMPSLDKLTKVSPQSAGQAVPFGQYQENLFTKPISTANYNALGNSTINTPPMPVAGHEWALNACSAPTPQIQEHYNMQLEPTVPAKVEQFPLVHLQKLLTESSPEVLEQGFATGIELLKSMELPLQQHSDIGDAQQWLQRIQSLQTQAVRSRTVIGVVGNTGAGKSSVINALLDEERLVPTNCMRACTAVVTELSWNDASDDDEDHKYQAEIEFIKAADWEKELRILFDDLLDTNGNVSRDASNADSDAGIAYAKIRAVYPNKTKEDLAASSVAGLMADSTVARVLGTTVNINSAQPDRFYSRLQNYVDSKDKIGGRKKERSIEYWPLIKVVRIYTKANALSTGAVIVDLPGVHDSNAARAAVADGYMKQCSGLWIVAPITRAVDDKAAKSLLGDTFKRQLKYDGTYSNVTFICSKTDDISIQEATETLDLEDEMQEYFGKLTELTSERRKLKKSISELREKKETLDDLMNELADKEEIWEGLEDKCRDGETVYAPFTNEAKKRKRGDSSSGSRKKLRASSESGSEAAYRDDDDDCTDDERNGDSEADVTAEDEAGDREPIGLDAVLAEIEELRKLKKEMRREKSGLDQPLRELTAQVKKVEQEEEAIEAKISARCISGRNSYSKVAIRQDFAAGIKELDQENAAETDEANFNPDEDVRDYDEVARSLPVFCVSSRAYQRLSGRFKKEKDVPGFVDVEETEVPLLQAHCKKLTESGRYTNCRRFLNNLSQLLNSITFWAASYGTDNGLSFQSRKPGAKFLEVEMARLRESLYQTVRSTSVDLKELLQDNIYEKYPKAVQAASSKAAPTAQKWGAPVNRDDFASGGLYWATYKAICRRDGVFANARGTYDFNGQLAEPMIKHLSTGWEKAFARNLPRVLDQFRRTTASLLTGFHQAVERRALEMQLGIPGLAMLSQQLKVYSANLADVSGTVREKINATQREASREFIPVIRAAMLAAYNYCNAERGQGCFARMKNYMNSHTENECHYMFAHATEHVTNILTSMCLEVEGQMVCQVDGVLDCIQRDYRSVIAGGPEDKMHTESLKDLREEIMRLVKEADGRFANGDAAEDDRHVEDENNEDMKRSDRSATRSAAFTESDAGAGEDARSRRGQNGHEDGTGSADRATASEEKDNNISVPTVNNDDDCGTDGSEFYNAQPFHAVAHEVAGPQSEGLGYMADNGGNEGAVAGGGQEEEEGYDVCWNNHLPDPYEEFAHSGKEGYGNDEEEEEEGNGGRNGNGDSDDDDDDDDKF